MQSWCYEECSTQIQINEIKISSTTTRKCFSLMNLLHCQKHVALWPRQKVVCSSFTHLATWRPLLRIWKISSDVAVLCKKEGFTKEKGVPWLEPAVQGHLHLAQRNFPASVKQRQSYLANHSWLQIPFTPKTSCYTFDAPMITQLKIWPEQTRSLSFANVTWTTLARLVWLDPSLVCHRRD